MWVKIKPPGDPGFGRCIYLPGLHFRYLFFDPLPIFDEQVRVIKDPVHPLHLEEPDLGHGAADAHRVYLCRVVHPGPAAGCKCSVTVATPPRPFPLWVEVVVRGSQPFLLSARFCFPLSSGRHKVDAFLG